MSDRERPYIQYLERRRQDGLARSLTPCTHPEAGVLLSAGRRYVNFSTNDYLGLSQHRDVKGRAIAWAEQYGTGSGASRLVTGNVTPFGVVEGKLAQLKKRQAALIFPSGFQANASALQALLDKRVLGTEPLVFADKLNHASMHFGCAAAQVRQIRYRHLDAGHLEELLEKHKDEDRPRFILTESVFSMDGDVAPMDDICNLARRYDCTVICDDAHGAGILGEGGEGLSGDADIVVGTFSKALGSIGAYVACSETVRNFLINHCSGFVYSTAVPPMVLGAMDAALDLLPRMDEERRHVARIAQMFRDLAREKGYDCGLSTSQIAPLIVGETDKALQLSERLKENGYWASAIRPPTVPKGTARLRFTFCPSHTEDHIAGVLDCV